MPVFGLFFKNGAKNAPWTFYAAGWEKRPENASLGDAGGADVLLYIRSRGKRVNRIFFGGARGKKGIAEKNRLRSYPYGYNGKEKDTEGLGGGGSTYDYGFRIYNPGIARFLSVDPLTKEFPFYTPYQFAGNKPIEAIDLDGLEEMKVFILQKTKFSGYDNALKVLNKAGILQELKQQFAMANKGVDIYFNVTPLSSEDHKGSTKFYDTGDGSQGALQVMLNDIRDQNPSMPLIDVMNNSVKKGKQVLVIQLNEENVIKAGSDINKLKELTETMVHELDSHALDLKDGVNDVPANKEHQTFYNDKSQGSMTTVGYDEIKKDSKAGQYKLRIEKAVKDLNLKNEKKAKD